METMLTPKEMKEALGLHGEVTIYREMGPFSGAKYSATLTIPGITLTYTWGEDYYTTLERLYSLYQHDLWKECCAIAQRKTGP